MIVRDPIIELKDTKIWQYLNNVDVAYAERAIDFVKEISPLLKKIQLYFPFYTRHDAHHGFRVLKRMDQIINKGCLLKTNSVHFTNIEAFLLICSAYGHDLGMTIFPNEENELLNQLEISKETDWINNIKLQKYLRENHSIRGGKYISENNDNLSIPDNLVSPLNLLMAAHNMSINDLERQLGKRTAAGEQELDMKQLACILCIADSLEFSETRIVDGVLDLLKEKIKNASDPELLLSYQENMKHVSIGDSLAIGHDGKIIISGSFKDPDILNLGHRTIDLIESWTRDYIDIDLKSKNNRLIIRADSIERNLTILGYDFERLGIRIKKEHIVNLISSNSTWSNNHAIVLRELLQNSVEACRYRTFNTPDNFNYKPQITVNCSKKDRSITIIDNGCGMSRNTVLNNFLTVGNSRSMDTGYMSLNYSSLARFGIGFWSTFTIASKATIETAPFEYLHNSLANNKNVDGLQFEVCIEEFKDYTVFKKTNRLPGTTIKLFLKDNISIDDLLVRLNYNLVCSEIPIKINNDDNDSYDIPYSVVLPSFNEIVGPKKHKAFHSGLKEFIYEENIGDVDFKLKIFYCVKDGASTFMVNKTSSILQLLDLVMHIGPVAICGFTVGVIPPQLIFDFPRVGTMICNIKNPGKYIYNLNRLNLLASQEKDELKEIITDLIHKGYREFLVETNSYSNERIYNMNTHSRLHGGNNYGYYSKDKLFSFHLKAPDLLIFKLIKIDADKEFENTSILYLTLNELTKLDLELWALTSHVYPSLLKINLEETKDIYRLFTKVLNISKESYLLECNGEVSLLFDNDPNSSVEIVTIPQLHAKFPLQNIQTKNIRPFNTHDWLICEIKGKWSGAITAKKVHGATFAFLSRENLIINPGTILCIEVKDLYNAGQTMKIAKLISLLYESTLGNLDESIYKYL